MSKKYTIFDPDAALAALHELVDTINATGGVTPAYDNPPLERNTPAPVGDEDWIDLAMAYEQACRALGVPVQWAEPVRLTSNAEPAEEQREDPAAVQPSAAELEVLEAKARELGLASEDLDDVVHDIASDVASSINDQGLYEQIAYWASEGWATVDAIKEELTSISREKSRPRKSRAAKAGETRDEQE